MWKERISFNTPKFNFSWFKIIMYVLSFCQTLTLFKRGLQRRAGRTHEIWNWLGMFHFQFLPPEAGGFMDSEFLVFILTYLKVLWWLQVLDIFKSPPPHPTNMHYASRHPPYEFESFRSCHERATNPWKTGSFWWRPGSHMLVCKDLHAELNISRLMLCFCSLTEHLKCFLHYKLFRLWFPLCL